MKTILASLLAITASTAVAATVTIVDTTPGTANNNGVISPGEYAGSSLGINQGSGDIIGVASRLYIDSDTSGKLSFGLQSAGNNNFGLVVIYIDSQTGGLNSTVPITDASDTWRAAISGNGSNSGESELNFAPDFFADYAIAIAGNSPRLYWILGDGSLFFAGTPTFTRDNNQVWKMDLSVTNIGIAANSGASFKYVATHIQNTSNANRSNEFQGVADGSFSGSNIGSNPATLASGDYNVFQVVPEPSSSFLFAASALGLFLIRRHRELPENA